MGPPHRSPLPSLRPRGAVPARNVIVANSRPVPTDHNGVMSRIALVNHTPDLSPGRLKPFLDRHDVVEVWAPDGEFPRDVDAAVVMGGFMGAYETSDHPWLVTEKQWLAESVEQDMPVLGICLGSQLLADALGGRAYLAPAPEVGVVEMMPTEEGKRHPVMAALGTRSFFAHQDTFDVPPAATLLARTASHPAAFTQGSALALQPHPETPLWEALSWADEPGFDMPERVGMSREEYMAQLEEFADEAEAAAEKAFGAWFHGWEQG